MHNLAMAVASKQGYVVTGSDDDIFDPALIHLRQAGLLPDRMGWHPERITPDIDAIILGCTHYPLLMDKIRTYMPSGIEIIPQGNYVAHSLKQYLANHPEMQQRISQGGTATFYTTEYPEQFNESASIFMDEPVEAHRITLS